MQHKEEKNICYFLMLMKINWFHVGKVKRVKIKPFLEETPPVSLKNKFPSSGKCLHARRVFCSLPTPVKFIAFQRVIHHSFHTKMFASLRFTFLLSSNYIVSHFAFSMPKPWINSKMFVDTTEELFQIRLRNKLRNLIW